jgi:hypothetical protein
VMKATSTSETSVYFDRLNSGTSQRAAIFIYFIIGLEMDKFYLLFLSNPYYVLSAFSNFLFLSSFKTFLQILPAQTVI